MGVVYQLTFFIALGLLAIVVTIFVFAVSQVGRATESASKEQQDILLKQKQAKAKQIEKIQERLEEAKKVGHLDETKLLKELENTKEEIAGYDTELRSLQERIMLIRRKGAVVWPGAFSLATLVLTITASGLAEIQNLVALPLWIISIGTLTFGIFRVYRTLGAIEEVTITSQQAMEKLPQAVKIALRELEEEKKPELELAFSEKLPLHIKSNSEKEVEFVLNLVRGDEALDTLLYLAAPPGFDFPNKVTLTQDAEHPTIPNYITTQIKVGNVKRGISRVGSVSIKASPQKGTFNLYYRMVCSGFDSGENLFKVIAK